MPAVELSTFIPKIFVGCFVLVVVLLYFVVYCAEAEPLKMAGGGPSGSAKPNSTAGF